MTGHSPALSVPEGLRRCLVCSAAEGSPEWSRACPPVLARPRPLAAAAGALQRLRALHAEAAPPDVFPGIGITP